MHDSRARARAAARQRRNKQMKDSRVSLLIHDACLAPGKDPSGAAARSSGAIDASALDSAGWLRRPMEGWSYFIYISKHSNV